MKIWRNLKRKFFSKSIIFQSRILIHSQWQMIWWKIKRFLLHLYILVLLNDFMSWFQVNKRIIKQVWKNIKRKKKLIVKISQKMLKIDEAIRVFARSYILFEMMSVFIRKILQFLITKYKKIDDQIKKQLHEKFQALKQSSFKNQIETWIIDWKNLRNRILTFDIKDFFDFETMFVEKFLIVDRKWVSTFYDNWILQNRAIEKNVHFAKTIREYKNVVKKNLKIVEHVNAVIFQNQSQSQS